MTQPRFPPDGGETQLAPTVLLSGLSCLWWCQTPPQS